MYQSGKLLNGKLVVKADGLWISLQALVAFEQKSKM